MDAQAAASLLELAEDASPRLREADGKGALDDLQRSHDQLLAAMAWLGQGRVDESLRLANALYRYWITPAAIHRGRRVVRPRPRFSRRRPAPQGSAHNLAGFMPFWRATMTGRRRTSVAASRSVVSWTMRR